MTVFGLVGEKLSHSFSAEIHKKIFEEIKIDASYSLFEVSREYISNIAKSLKVLGISGVNITIPYKEEIISQIDYISPEAKKIGAINTIKIDEGRICGYNTDYYGFGKMLSHFNINVENKKIVILGSGGAARAVYQYVLDNNGEIEIVSRNKKDVQEKFKEAKILNYDDLKDSSERDIIINTTPCGMYPKVDTCAVDDRVISKFKEAVDIVYNPYETLFLKKSKDLGLKTVNGLYMLVGQAIKSEEIWNNIVIQEDILKKVHEFLRNSQGC